MFQGRSLSLYLQLTTHKTKIGKENKTEEHNEIGILLLEQSQIFHKRGRGGSQTLG